MPPKASKIQGSGIFSRKTAEEKAQEKAQETIALQNCINELDKLNSKILLAKIRKSRISKNIELIPERHEIDRIMKEQDEDLKRVEELMYGNSGGAKKIKGGASALKKCIEQKRKQEMKLDKLSSEIELLEEKLAELKTEYPEAYKKEVGSRSQSSSSISDSTELDEYLEQIKQERLQGGKIKNNKNKNKKR